METSEWSCNFFENFSYIKNCFMMQHMLGIGEICKSNIEGSEIAQNPIMMMGMVIHFF